MSFKSAEHVPSSYPLLGALLLFTHWTCSFLSSSLCPAMTSTERSSSVQFTSVTQSCLALQPHGLQHARLPCPSPTRWTWVWLNSGSWCWPGRPGVLQFTGLQIVRHDWATELNWSDGNKSLRLFFFFFNEIFRVWEPNSDWLDINLKDDKFWTEVGLSWWSQVRIQSTYMTSTPFTYWSIQI